MDDVFSENMYTPINITEVRKNTLLTFLKLQEKSRSFDPINFQSHHDGLLYLTPHADMSSLKTSPVLMMFYDAADTSNTSVEKLVSEVQKLTLREKNDPINSKVYALFYRENKKSPKLFFRPLSERTRNNPRLQYSDEVFDRSIDARVEEQFASKLRTPVGYVFETGDGPKVSKYEFTALRFSTIIDKAYREKSSTRYFDTKKIS